MKKTNIWENVKNFSDKGHSFYNKMLKPVILSERNPFSLATETRRQEMLLLSLGCHSQSSFYHLLTRDQIFIGNIF